MLLITENRHDIGANVGVIPVRIHDDASHEVLENGDRLMDRPLRGDELLAAGDVPERGVGLHLRCVEGGPVGLEHGGFMSRGPDPADSRRNRLEITAAGRALLAQLESSFRAMQEELLVSLSPEDRIELSRLLALIAEPAPALTRLGRER